ncbi:MULTISPECIES: hypothetical protein [Thalassospira]|uniref:Uncharacterized protein n=2 Tax=Thalassospira TaxID=168934 RepID=A0A367W6U3_9PROT|nr:MULTISPECIES: hypothetical protein [Thalassospira]MDG4719628.1 hypothetical protein [Thalassospira sp. FZY0004]RCK36331.1 hypothetical protein TH19_13760 [Thalassospira profundimaris]
MTDPVIMRAHHSHIYPGLRIDISSDDHKRLLSAEAGNDTSVRALVVMVQFVDDAIAFGEVETGLDDECDLTLLLGAYVTGKGTEIPAKRWLIANEKAGANGVELKVRKRLPV